METIHTAKVSLHAPSVRPCVLTFELVRPSLDFSFFSRKFVKTNFYQNFRGCYLRLPIEGLLWNVSQLQENPCDGVLFYEGLSYAALVFFEHFKVTQE